jgi:RHS repeat-associated protein
MKNFIKLGTVGDTPEVPDTPPTENAPLHRGEATEIEETHRYIYAGGKLLRETISDGTTTKTLDFNYDNVGMPYSLIYNNGTTTTTYYYITNLQGDVMYLVDANGVQVAAYDYDPYGKIISATGDLAEINPLRYRGYYYDTETGFYYLQSRYYDPEICRFINADSYASTEQGFIGYNMFAYCDNNPVIRFDNGGTFWNIVIGAAVGAIVSGVVSFATQAIEHGIENVNWARVGIAAASGAITGGCAASGIPVNGQMIVGGVVGAVSSGLDTYYAYKNSDEKATVWDYTKNIAIGATLGVIGGRLGGSGTGTKHLTQSAKQALSRGKNAISSLGKQGVKYVTKELAKTGKYYYSQIAVEAVRAGRQAIKSILIGAIPSASYSILSVV